MSNAQQHRQTTSSTSTSTSTQPTTDNDDGDDYLTDDDSSASDNDVVGQSNNNNITPRSNNNNNNMIIDDTQEVEGQDKTDTMKLLGVVSALLDQPTLDRLSSQVKDEEAFYNNLHDMIVDDDGVLHQSFDDVYWELVHSLIVALGSSSSDWSMLTPNHINPVCSVILKILGWISLNGSAREFLLVVEELHSSSFFEVSFFTKMTLISLIENALTRISVEKRYNFMKSLLPLVLSVVQDESKKQQTAAAAAQDAQALKSLASLSTSSDADDEDGDDDGQAQTQTPSGVNIVGQANEEELQQRNTPNDLKWEYPLSCIIAFFEGFIADLKIQEPIEAQANNATPSEITKQQHLILQTLIQLVSTDIVLNPPQPLLFNGLPIFVTISDMLAQLGVSFSYLLKTDQRFREKRRELELEDMYFDQGLDEEDLIEPGEEQQPKTQQSSSRSKSTVATSSDDEDEEDDDEDYEDDEDDLDNVEEMMWDLELPYTGIGYILYNLLLRPTENYRLSSILSPVSLLKDNLPYLIALLQSESYRAGFKAIQIISFLHKRIKPCGIDIPQEYLSSGEGAEQHGDATSPREKWLIDTPPTMVEDCHHFLQLFQSMVSFLVKCPVQKIRSFAFNQLTLSMATLSAQTRFNLLATLIRHCAFPSFTGLLIHIFKEQIDACWLTTDTDLRNYFVSPKILEILYIPMQVGGNLLERMDSIMNALNLYRYLLIRDKDSNSTGVWAKSKIAGAKESFLLPLKAELGKIKQEFASSASGDQAAIKKALKGVSKLGVDSMDSAEIQRASQIVCCHIELATDVVDRIFELQDSLKVDD
ncbi:hypothetical protein SAMD00019534_031700 [Acytostelium subglobosum LB1]|uniref:hypothetical protein n=1 Tax=Acytostelium subglobosum LB1 TaxID=1410327 RepID=UPI000644DD28|nr:hypothetical protein SAMD00019534_031700 [Acytostelium subglobosum LB1]GAM19995.1 hypothetical protein SAMD00019534_031700 [Acytostelium subglobosum LB1]|eukprot:XP_012756757.1 hypothetical protein SAMD00019534_031700 [Acytostelium subglobosum LB1]